MIEMVKVVLQGSEGMCGFGMVDLIRTRMHLT